ncbi:hypothetical protein LSH36_546g01022 [Paralvinella palmiformis]|uniref:Large ribosomal subunit protein uL10m n=1 Tax=Paralvinella palmiformis TaxID=53620 RepID=A0AAD9J6Y0_9ANNE|nr:hypothetical protein LSH36_546g01022 [Paralvinella palmiformis]
MAKMSALGKVKLFTPLLIQCRHKSKHFIQRPRPSHLDRRIFEAVTVPLLPEKIHDPYANCPRLRRRLQAVKEDVVQDEMENAYENYLMGICRRMLEENRMIIAFQLMAMSTREKVDIKRQLFLNGLKLKFVSNAIFSDTKWINLSPLLCSHNAYVVSPDVDISRVIKLTHKMPELILLGGLVNDQLFTREGLQRYAKLPDIDVLRGQLVAVLNATPSRTKSLLEHHQQTLSRNLDQYVKDNTEKS